MKLLPILLLLISTSTMACNDCNEYYQYLDSEWNEVDICFDGYDVNMDNKFDRVDVIWMLSNSGRVQSTPFKEDQIGDFDGTGLISGENFCELYEEATKHGFVTPVDDCLALFPY